MMEVVGQVEADPDQLAFGSVVAVAKVLRCIDMEPSPRSPHYLWWAGPLAWELDEVFALPYPIRAKGKQGLWSLDERQTGCVRLQWKAAHRPADLTEEETERLGLMDPATH
jgi:hypothetical protein